MAWPGSLTLWMVASRLVAQGYSVETVQLLLGRVHLDYVAPYLEVSKSARREAMADLGGVFAEGCD